MSSKDHPNVSVPQNFEFPVEHRPYENLLFSFYYAKKNCQTKESILSSLIHQNLFCMRCFWADLNLSSVTWKLVGSHSVLNLKKLVERYSSLQLKRKMFLQNLRVFWKQFAQTLNLSQRICLIFNLLE